MNHSDEEKILQDSLIRIKELKKELYTIKQEPIAIIGLGCRFPGGADNPAAYWQLLKNHQNAVTEIPKNRWDVDAYYSADNSSVGKSYARHGAFLKDGVDKFDPLFFNISPIEAPMIDPRQRLLLEVVWESLEDANLVPEEIKNSSTSLFIGISGNEWGELLHEQTDNEAQKAAGISLSMLSGRISHFFGLKGPSVVLDTACSGSLVAVHQACQSLRSGESNLALAGGINLLLSPYGFVISAKANLLSINGCCKTFDQGADGHVRGEGCGIVVLKRLSDAQKNHDRILAVIKGSAVNHDGASGGLMIPNGKVQEELIRTALYNANLQPDDINYLEVQGTASKIGDPIEAKAIYNVFCRKNNDNKRTQPLIIGTVKANIGHTEAAAGIAGLIKTVLALQNEEIPKQLHFEKKNQSIIDFEAIPAQIPINSTAWKRKNGYLRRAGISAFGFSGTNAHVIIEETSSLVEVTQKSSNTSHLLLISAKNSTSLHQQIQNYIVFLKNTDQDIADICYTSQIGRTHFKKRVGIEGLTHEDFVEKLQTINSSLDNLDETNNSSLLKQFMSGENINWRGMNLYNYENVKKALLPLYPFLKEIYWPESLNKTLPVLNEKNNDQMVSVDKLQSDANNFLEKIQTCSVEQEKQLIFAKVADVLKIVFGIVLEDDFDDQNLRELGMSSFMLLQLQQHLQPLIGSKAIFSPNWIAEYNTVGKLKNYVYSLLCASDLTPTDETLTVCLKSDGKKFPLFCIPGIDGHHEIFIDLLEKLKINRPIYAIRAPELLTNNVSIFSLPERASLYLNEIKKIQSQGPYHLLGWSMGGMVAIEISNQLHTCNEKVDFLAAIDTYVNNESKDIELTYEDAAKFYLQALNQSFCGTDEVFKQGSSQDLLLAIRGKLNELGLLTVSIEEIDKNINIIKNNMVQFLQYTFPGSINEVFSFDTKESAINNFQSSNDKLFSHIKRLTGKNVKYFSITGNHFNLLRRENNTILAQYLMEFLA